MNKLKSFNYLFIGEDTELLNSIQTYFERQSIYPLHRQIRDKNGLIESIKNGDWEIILVNENLKSITLREIFDITTNNQTTARLVLILDNIDIDKLKYLIEKRFYTICVRSNIDDIYNTVLSELKELEKIKREKRLKSIENIIEKYEVIRRFAGNVSHKINDMLMVIINSSVFISENPSTQNELKNEIEQIIKVSKKGQGFAQNLLKIASSSVLNVGVYEINSLLQKITDNIKMTLGSNININLSKNNISREIKVDERLITEAFSYILTFLMERMNEKKEINIKTNSISFEKDDPFIRASRLREGEYFKIEISGEEVTLQSEDKNHIFEPFYFEKGISKGTGMDLTISFGIIWEHNGIIDIEETENKATSFVIYLPVYKRDSKETLIPRATEYFTQSKGAILIVEDDEEVKNVLLRIFSGIGFKVIDAIDGLAALVMLQKTKPEDLKAIITDVIMPKMSGVELAKEIRKKYKDVKIIFISGYPENREDILNFPNSIFIQKPISKDILLKKVKDFLFLNET